MGTNQTGGSLDSILDRKPRLALFWLLLLPFLSHVPQFLAHVHNDPIWQFSFLTTVQIHSRLPGQNYLDPNIGFTTQALGKLAATDWLHGIVPWWNYNVGVGLPLAGEMQPQAFFLPFVLLLALPSGVTLQTIAIQLVAGLATYALLRELKLSRWASLAGATLFALNGTTAWSPGPAGTFCSAAFLPVLILGIEKARPRTKAALPTALICVGIGWSLLAGFPETAFLDGLLGLAWAIFRFIQSDVKWKFACRVIVGGLLGLLVATPQLIAFAQYLSSSYAIEGHLYGLSFLDLRAFSMFWLPTVFGPINAGKSLGTITDTWGSIGGYSTVFAAFLASLSFFAVQRERGLRLFLVFWVVIAMLKTFGAAPIVWAVNLLPGMKLVAFDRYAAPSWEFALIVLTAFGLDTLASITIRRRHILTTVALAFILIAVCLILARPRPGWSSLQITSLWRFWYTAAIWSVLLPLVVLTAHWRGGASAARFVAFVLAALEALVLFGLPQRVGWVGGALDLTAVNFLQQHIGLYRVVTLGPLAPNYGAYFGFSEINHNLNPVPQLWRDYVDTHLLPNYSKLLGGTVFWPILTPPQDLPSAAKALKEHATEYSEMGVSYAIAPPGIDLSGITAPMPTGPNTPLALKAGETVRLRITLPARQPLLRLGFLLGTYGNTSDGSLQLRVCSNSDCRYAQGSLSDASDNMFDYLALNSPLPVTKDVPLEAELTHQGGKNQVALWIWPNQDAAAKLESAPRYTGAAAAPIGFVDEATPQMAQRVHHGPAADVWKLPGARPYFDAGSDCKLTYDTREEVSADCLQSATLVRRELFFDGWEARVNGNATVIAPHGDILEEIALPPGHSLVKFHFAPPYANYGWLACSLGLLALLWLTYGSIAQARHA